MEDVHSYTEKYGMCSSHAQDPMAAAVQYGPLHVSFEKGPSYRALLVDVQKGVFVIDCQAGGIVCSIPQKVDANILSAAWMSSETEGVVLGYDDGTIEMTSLTKMKDSNDISSSERLVPLGVEQDNGEDVPWSVTHLYCFDEYIAVGFCRVILEDEEDDDTDSDADDTAQHEANMYIYHIPSQVWTELGDVVSFFSALKFGRHVYYTQYVKPQGMSGSGLLMVGCNLTGEIGVVAKDDEGEWQICELQEGSNATAPITDEDEFTVPSGLAASVDENGHIQLLISATNSSFTVIDLEHATDEDFSLGTKLQWLITADPVVATEVQPSIEKEVVKEETKLVNVEKPTSMPIFGSGSGSSLSFGSTTFGSAITPTFGATSKLSGPQIDTGRGFGFGSGQSQPTLGLSSTTSSNFTFGTPSALGSSSTMIAPGSQAAAPSFGLSNAVPGSFSLGNLSEKLPKAPTLSETEKNAPIFGFNTATSNFSSSGATIGFGDMAKSASGFGALAAQKSNSSGFGDKEESKDITGSTDSIAVKKASQVFDELDINKDGKVSIDRVDDLLDGIGEGFYGEEMEKQMKLLDPDSTGFVNREIFMSWYQNLDNSSENDESIDSEERQEREEERSKAETKFDALAENGILSSSNFGKLMEAMGTTYCEEEHKRTIEQISDTNGTIPKHAFIKWYIDWIFGDYESDSERSNDQINISENATDSGANQGWGSTFTFDKGSWKCEVCMVRNTENAKICLSCETCKPGLEDICPTEQVNGKVVPSPFTFGFSEPENGQPADTGAEIKSTSKKFSFEFKPSTAPDISKAPLKDSSKTEIDITFGFKPDSSVQKSSSNEADATTASNKRKYASAAFDAVDTFKSEEIAISKMEDLLEEVGEGFYGEELDKQQKLLDPDDIGFIKKSTFIEWYCDLGTHKEDDSGSLDTEEREEREEERQKALNTYDSVATNGELHKKNFGKLIEAMGTTYCEEEHRRTLRKIAGKEDNITKDAFVNWYINWLFGDDYDETVSEDNMISNIESNAPATTDGWGQTFTIEKDSWKCNVCMIRNSGDEQKCSACETARPGNEEQIVTNTITTKNSIPPPICGFSFGFEPKSDKPPEVAKEEVEITKFTFGLTPETKDSATTSSTTAASTTTATGGSSSSAFPPMSSKKIESLTSNQSPKRPPSVPTTCTNQTYSSSSEYEVQFWNLIKSFDSLLSDVSEQGNNLQNSSLNESLNTTRNIVEELERLNSSLSVSLSTLSKENESSIMILSSLDDLKRQIRESCSILSAHMGSKDGEHYTTGIDILDEQSELTRRKLSGKSFMIQKSVSRLFEQVQFLESNVNNKQISHPIPYANQARFKRRIFKDSNRQLLDSMAKGYNRIKLLDKNVSKLMTELQSRNQANPVGNKSNAIITPTGKRGHRNRLSITPLPFSSPLGKRKTTRISSQENISTLKAMQIVKKSQGQPSKRLTRREIQFLLPCDTASTKSSWKKGHSSKLMSSLNTFDATSNVSLSLSATATNITKRSDWDLSKAESNTSSSLSIPTSLKQIDVKKAEKEALASFGVTPEKMNKVLEAKLRADSLKLLTDKPRSSQQSDSVVSKKNSSIKTSPPDLPNVPTSISSAILSTTKSSIPPSAVPSKVKDLKSAPKDLNGTYPPISSTAPTPFGSSSTNKDVKSDSKIASQKIDERKANNEGGLFGSIEKSTPSLEPASFESKTNKPLSLPVDSSAAPAFTFSASNTESAVKSSSTQPNYEELLTAFYQKHNPSKLSEVKSNLQKYAGKEKEMFAKLAQKYGVPNPLNTAETGSVSIEQSLPSFTQAASPFGQPSSTFGNSSLTGMAASPFDSSKAKQGTPFGSTSAIANAPLGTNSGFGSSATPFGISNNSTSISPFNQNQSTSQSPFGAKVTTSTTPFGQSVSPTPFSTSTTSAASSFGGKSAKEILTSFYQQHNPSKIDEIDKLLQKYAGNEEQLFRNLAKKYNMDPSMFGVTSNAPAPSFGSQSAFGQPSTPATSSGFGSSAFGQSSALGNSGGFGQSAPSFGQTSGFGAMSSGPSSGFASFSQSTQGTGFGGLSGSTPAFGSPGGGFGASSSPFGSARR
jgi:Ca2+-binding EF-hand superfamily protein